MYSRYHPSITATSLSADAAAEAEAVRKMAKYAGLTAYYIFLTLAFESPGPISFDEQQFIEQLGRCISEFSVGDNWERRLFIFQRLSLTAIKRFNEISF